MSTHVSSATADARMWPDRANRFLRRWGPPAGALAVYLVVWHLFVTFELGQLELPTPVAFLGAVGEVGTSGEFWSATRQSGTVFVLGLFPGVLVGVLMGLVIGNLRRLDTALSPYLFAFFSTPFIALIPLFLVVFGFGTESKAVIVFTLVWIMVVLQTIEGVRDVDPTYLEVARSFRAPWYRRWFGVTLPAAMPFIIVGVRLGIGRSLVGVVVAEFETSVTGLGALILLYAQRLDLASAAVPALLLAVTGVILTAGLRKLEQRVRRWKGDDSG